ncbi:biotin--[acetyl-CoA-carboxylase] ligase [Aequorivita soesokkakensis]|uniref:Biotin--[acetyl-CoA-carboxylase] ligase n=1 Tax=Aequorivita soesokkakensis TaxID=1385699 RepID=A0A1A9LGL6_9FLAO|nr:biotin--[acetyl-CoA-carboxylase] ligase [Aequorivita soesokkakensis]OAD92247.1 biotin--[acetyl-CoA-carboxylase] ligase [Aequorivita soesokkakensis]
MKIIKLNAIDSTNSYLKQLAKETFLQEETVVLTNRQLSGRGQMGNKWLSREGQSLTFSMFKAFEKLQIEQQFMISMVVSLAIVKALKSLNVPKVTIKWPNDILSANTKIGGILIENVLESSFVKYSIIGIGLNVNETDFPNLPQASSMKLETGKTFQLEEVLDTILKNVFKNLKNISEKDFSEMKQLYENNLFRKERISVFETSEGSQINGIIKGVSDIGELLVETENNPLQKFQLKEVKLIY